MTIRSRPLVLLDIDGTLLHSGGGGRRAFARALQTVFQWQDDLAWVNFSGATDLEVLRQICERHGSWPDAERVAQFFDELARELDRALAASPPRLLPGVKDLLDELEGVPGLILGLVTGNISTCADIKLRHAGLHGRFVLGAFGHEHAKRVEIARLALRRAEAHARGAALAPIVLIGDTPSDVAAARAIGARAVAVATGAHDVAALRRAGADVVVTTLCERDVLRPLWQASGPVE